MRKIERRYGGMFALGFLATALSAVAGGAEEIVRTPLPDGNPFPISAAVTVRAGVDTVYVSGALPAAINKDAGAGCATRVLTRFRFRPLPEFTETCTLNPTFE